MKRSLWFAAVGLVSSVLSVASDLAGVVSVPLVTAPIRYASSIPGLDMGAEINALYDTLPATGGEIVVQESASFATPILFGTNGKPALLVGLPADIVTLTYTGSSGAALTFDYGTGHRMGHGLRDLTLTGPGHSTDTIGVVFGGVNGAEGLDFRDFKVQSFGVNLQMGSNTWLAMGERMCCCPLAWWRPASKSLLATSLLRTLPPPTPIVFGFRVSARKLFSPIAHSIRRNFALETAPSPPRRS
jgi:hypothetical protein